SSSELTVEERENLQAELAQIDDEISTLRQVLLTKEKHAAEIRRQLGLSPLSNIKQNLSKGWQEVQTSSPYLRGKENLSYAGQVTSSALSSVGVAITRRLAEMRCISFSILIMKINFYLMKMLIKVHISIILFSADNHDTFSLRFKYTMTIFHTDLN
uniref:Tpd52 like 2a n=1 Tax=Sphaeramia orbicularis TaxID=375764 RepID=A0A672ZG93_9TELE